MIRSVIDEQHLHDALVSFAPLSLRRRIAADPSPMQKQEASSHEVVVLFADISGFTALTRRLALEGPRGAERLTIALNDFFGCLIEVILENGGDVVKFAGDALYAIWEDPLGQLPAAGRATTAALEAQRRIAELEGDLSMKIGLAAGWCTRMSVGGRFGRWETFLAGKPLQEMSIAEGLANPGDVVLAASVVALLGDTVSGERLAESCLRARSHRAIAPERSSIGDELQPSSEVLDALRAYVPGAIRARLSAGHDDWIAEFRKLTVLFINVPGLDLDGAGALERAQRFMEATQTTLYRYEGSVNKLLVDDKGTSLVVAFGLPPLAHEDDAVRGARAAIDIRAQLEAMSIDSKIGVATGAAFCGPIGSATRREYTMIGDVVNRAARLMKAASDVLCDGETVTQARGRLSFELLDSIDLKGMGRIDVARPLAARRVLDGDGSSDGLMCGRVAELEALDQVADALIDGVGGSWMVSGVAGIGKSRLCRELASKVMAKGGNVLQGEGSAIEKATPFFAWRSVFDDPEPGTGISSVLGRALEQADSDVDDQAFGGETMQLLSDLLVYRLGHRPTMILLENAQSFDSATWALADRVAREVPTVLVAITTRPLVGDLPVEASSWIAEARGLVFGALDPEANEELIADVLGCDTLEAGLAELLFSRTAGHPMFTIELATSLREGGAIEVVGRQARLARGIDLDALDLPESIREVVTTRLDRLPAELQLTIKVASVFGGDFSIDLLRQVHPMSPPDLVAQIAELGRRDLLRAVEAGRIYEFCHALHAEVLYEQLPFSQRESLHGVIARAIEEDCADDLEAVLPALATHWSRAAGAGSDPKIARRAIECLLGASKQLARTCATLEVVFLSRRALELFDASAQIEDQQLELDILLQLASALMTTRGFSDPEVEESYDRAVGVCDGLGETEGLFAVICGLFQFYITAAELEKSEELAERLLELADHLANPELEMQARRAMGETMLYIGRFRDAQEHLELGKAIFDRVRAGGARNVNGMDPGITCHALASWSWWFLGDTETSLKRSDEAVDLARQHDRHFDLAMALTCKAALNQCRRDVSSTLEAAEEVIVVSQRHHFPFWRAVGQVFRGWAVACSGASDAGIKDLRGGFESYLAMGSLLARPWLSVLFADAVANHEDPSQELIEEALGIVGDALDLGSQTGESWRNSELLALRARLGLQLGGDPLSAEGDLSAALEVAIAQQCRPWELRVATPLARLLGERGEVDKAIEILEAALSEWNSGPVSRDAEKVLESLRGTRH